MAQTHDGAMKFAAKRAGISLDEFMRRRLGGTKLCIKCKEWKDADDFDTDRSRNDGKTSSCKACRRVRVRLLRITSCESTRHSIGHIPDRYHLFDDLIDTQDRVWLELNGVHFEATPGGVVVAIPNDIAMQLRDDLARAFQPVKK